MKTPKTIQSLSNLTFRQKKTNENKISDELVNPRFVIKFNSGFKPKKASNSLLVQMYSQENEVLFI
ncbi:MAG TPA: hypothetical protein VIH09_11720 [Flavobacterium sp.]|uniref:hypothetical protein n=1 Tax=Flavobacterium sp. TaxID=239 RepID=UPI002F41C936